MESEEVHIRAKAVHVTPISEIVENPKNPNRHSPEQIERLSELIKYQGFRNPLVVSERTGFLVVGHGRLQAAKKLGLKELPVMVQQFKDEAQEYAYLVSDNAISEWAELDFSKINQDFLDLGPELDIDMLGIKDFEIEPLDKLDPKTDEDAVPEIKGEPVTKRGDIWLLGDHRVMCGDSTMIDDVEKLMDGEKADMVFTDPPYNINYGNIKHSKFKQRSIENDNMSKEDFSIFCGLWVANIRAITSGCVYVWGPPGPDGRIIFNELDSQFHCSTVVIWNKDQFTLGRGKYQNKHEPCWFGWVESGRLFTDDRKLTNIWDFKRPKKSELHPTMKPVELCEHGISHASKTSVADLFLGSGSTLIACEKTNRKCYGMELDEHYCDVIINRWQEYTGKTATLEATGQTYTGLKNG